MKKLIAALLCLVSHGAHAKEESSLPICEVPVRFLADSMPDLSVDHSRSIAQLDALEGVPYSGARVGHVMVEARISIRPRKDCDGHEVQLAFVNPVLRVVRELREGSCGYEHVLEHERTHVRIYRDMAKQFAALTLPAHLEPEQAPAFAAEQYDILYRQQTALDSPAEYAKNHTVCGGEITRRIRGR